MSRCTLDVKVDAADLQAALADDVRRGLTDHPRQLSPRWFYDEEGSTLFEQITELPEYYPTRAERRVITTLAPELLARLRPREIVELGAGSLSKLRGILSLAKETGTEIERYVPIDVDGDTLRAAAETLTNEHPGLSVHAVVGDFERHLEHVPSAEGRRLILFLGSTIGNLHPGPRQALLESVRAMLAPKDRFLLGVDLVKDRAILEAAYNDSQGITAAFNRNILKVVNERLGGDFDPGSFEHAAWYEERTGRIEMHLRPTASQTVRILDLDLEMTVTPDETIWTESSYKFTRESIARDLADAGLALKSWHCDDRGQFGVAVAGTA